MSATLDHDERHVEGEERTELKRAIGPRLLLLFIVGDILGTGVYALTGRVASEVGGAAWAPFIVAFAIALVTAFSYLELVTKYPRAAGAALYTHKAFGIHFVTFLVAFTVMCSGITSASTASNAFAANLADGFGLDAENSTLVLGIALGFMLLVAAVNFRGVGESVKANVVLTLVELSGLLLVIFVGIYAATGGKADFSQVTVFDTAGDKNVFLAITAATSLAFFAMVGFEDAVNMAEETKDPVRNFPKMMLTGLGITGVIYVLVAIVAVALVPIGELGEGDTPLTKVVSAGRARLPDRQGDAVHRDVRGGQLGADQHADGEPAALRHGPPGRAAPCAGLGAPGPADPVGRHHLHHGDRLRADLLRQHQRQRRRAGARWHDRPAAARGVHDRQHRGARAAPRPDRPRRTS